MIKRFHTIRRIIGAVLLLAFIGLPFIRIRGESAFRFDIPTLRLLFFGTATGIGDFFIVLVALFFLTFLTVFVTTLFGRVWCGWLCPQTVLLDSAGSLEKFTKRGLAPRIGVSALIAGGSAVVSASLLGYFVSPFDIPGLIARGGSPANILAGSWIVVSVLLYLDTAVVGRTFCATVCPYAKLQSVLFDDRTLLVAFDPRRAGECRECQACVKACPVEIDIRKGSHPACIHCAECVDACSARMEARGRKSLIAYSFGRPGTQKKQLRINPLITGLATVLSLLFLAYLSVSRMPFDLNVRMVLPSDSQNGQAGSIAGRYELSIRNLTSSDIEVALTVHAPDAEVSVSPSLVSVKKGGDMIKVPAVVTLKGVKRPTQTVAVRLNARSLRDNKQMAKTIYFMVPKNR